MADDEDDSTKKAGEGPQPPGVLVQFANDLGQRLEMARRHSLAALRLDQDDALRLAWTPTASDSAAVTALLLEIEAVLAGQLPWTRIRKAHAGLVGKTEVERMVAANGHCDWALVAYQAARDGLVVSSKDHQRRLEVIRRAETHRYRDHGRGDDDERWSGLVERLMTALVAEDPAFQGLDSRNVYRTIVEHADNDPDNEGKRRTGPTTSVTLLLDLVAQATKSGKLPFGGRSEDAIRKALSRAKNPTT